MSLESLPRSEPSTEKLEHWKHLKAEVNRIVDSLGHPVDEAIKPLIVALGANEFSTTGSCEGHVDRALPYPWVDIESPHALAVYETPRFKELHKKEMDELNSRGTITDGEREELEVMYTNIRNANQKEYETLTSVLNDFYATLRESEPKLFPRMKLVKGDLNDCRLQPEDTPEWASVREAQAQPQNEKLACLVKYRATIERLSQFLKANYFRGAPPH